MSEKNTTPDLKTFVTTKKQFHFSVKLCVPLCRLNINVSQTTQSKCIHYDSC